MVAAHKPLPEIFYSQPDVARAIGVTDRSVYYWVDNGELVPDAFTATGKPLFRKATVDACRARTREKKSRGGKPQLWESQLKAKQLRAQQRKAQLRKTAQGKTSKPR